MLHLRNYNLMATDVLEILNDPQQLDEVTRTIFQHFDKDHSGHLDKKELKEALIMVSNDCGTIVPDDQVISELIEALDEDGNGFLDIDEFKVLVEELLKAIC